MLWGRYDLLAELPPFMGGGEMIENVDMTGTTYAAPPHRFEAGTPMIAEAVGLGAAIDYVSAIGMDNIQAREAELTALRIAGVRRGAGAEGDRAELTQERGATISFAVEGIHPHDVSQLLDEQGIAVRAGHHCARPVCSLRHPGDHSGVLRHLHHHRRDRRPGRGPGPGAGDVRMSEHRSGERGDCDELGE